MNSPIRYFGGKSLMINKLIKYFPHNYKVYVEGFGGGASLLLSNKVENLNKGKIEIYNDLNLSVYYMFKCISNKNKNQKLIKMLKSTPYCEHIWKLYKNKIKNTKGLVRAYYFIYVNRTSYNGIGGFTVNKSIRKGKSKSLRDYESCIENLPKVHKRMCSVIIHNRDVFDIIDKYDSKDTFFYLDPPYVQSTRKSNQKYDVEFSDTQHKKLVKRLLKVQGKVLLSGYDNKYYDKLIKMGWNKSSFKSNNGNSVATETIWYSYKI